MTSNDSPARIFFRRLFRAEDGLSLVELLTAMAIFGFVVAAAGAVLAPAQRSATADTENSTAQAEIQTSLDRMIRDLRQGTDVTLQAPNQMTVTLPNNQVVSYKCDYVEPGSTYRSCARLTAAAGAALPDPSPGNVVIRRLSNATPTDPVFNYTLPTVDDSADLGDEIDAESTADPPPPTYVRVTVKTPASGELTTQKGRNRVIQLDGGFELRNIFYSNGTGS